ncbi:MAG: methyltransferase domain-containing protein [Verrucomicrobia bacterium]|nr:methyltransferase domain-containing protein [Verrucomicrobiota bacterium]
MKRLLKKSEFLVAQVHAVRHIKADVRKVRWWFGRRRTIESYCAAHSVPKLQIGCGKNSLPGWLNTDLSPRPGQVYLDATRPFPFAVAGFGCIFTEHTIEHLTYEHGAFMLGECFRVLKPGGKIRVATPNLVNICSLVARPDGEVHTNYIKATVDKHMTRIGIYKPAFVVNNFFWDFGHYFVYDPDTLRLALEKAGFTSVRQCEIGQSEDEQLRGIESHGHVIGEDLNRFETMVMEATRP